MDKPNISVGNALQKISSNLPSPDDFEAYAYAVNRIPLLTQDEEKELGLAWRNNHDLDAAKKLILSHLRLVVKIVRDHMGYGYKHTADLVQEGNIGLMKAVSKFDPEKDNRLSTYATIWIEAEIRDFLLNNLRNIKIGGTPALKKLFFSYRKTMDKLNRNKEEHDYKNISNSDIAKKINIDESDVEVARSYFVGKDLSWDQTNDSTDDEYTLDSEASESRELSLADHYDNNPEDYIVNESEKEYRQALLLEAISLLDEREQDIVLSRRMAEEVKSLSQLAEKWKVSLERIRQIENEAISKMADYVKNKI